MDEDGEEDASGSDADEDTGASTAHLNATTAHALSEVEISVPVAMWVGSPQPFSQQS